MSIKVFHNTIIPQSCGVGEIGIFREEGEQGFGTGQGDCVDIVPKGGCGWVMASFTTQRPAYMKAYKELMNRWPLVYQSPPRINTRTKREFFFCIFDASKEKK